MTPLYLILTLAAPCICPSYNSPFTTFTNVNAGATVGGSVIVPTTACQQGADVDFTRTKETAEKALENGAIVFKIETMPLKIKRLERTSTTTYSVKENAEMPLKP